MGWPAADGPSPPRIPRPAFCMTGPCRLAQWRCIACTLFAFELRRHHFAGVMYIVVVRSRSMAAGLLCRKRPPCALLAIVCCSIGFVLAIVAFTSPRETIHFCGEILHCRRHVFKSSDDHICLLGGMTLSDIIHHRMISIRVHNTLSVVVASSPPAAAGGGSIPGLMTFGLLVARRHMMTWLSPACVCCRSSWKFWGQFLGGDNFVITSPSRRRCPCAHSWNVCIRVRPAHTR